MAKSKVNMNGKYIFNGILELLEQRKFESEKNADGETRKFSQTTLLSGS
jgi:hypothetical protein